MTRLLLLACATLLCSLAAPVLAEDPPGASESAPVKLAGRTVMVLRGPIAGYHASERASGSIERIEAALAAAELPAVTTASTPEGTRVLIGQQVAFVVTLVDVDAKAGETTAIGAREAAKRLRIAIQERREQESATYLLRAATYAAAATLIFGVLLWLGLRIHKWGGMRLAAHLAARAQRLSVGGVEVVGASLVVKIFQAVTNALWGLIALVLAWAWISYVLSCFPYTRAAGEQLGAQLATTFGLATVGFAEAIPGLLVVVLIVVIARAVTGVAGVFFERIVALNREVGWLNPGTAPPTQRIFVIVVWIFALATAYPYLPGSQSDAFKGLSVLVGLMVSLGATSVIGQGFSGLVLMYSGALHVGDFVRVGETEGTITDLGMFVTRIRTGLGQEVMLPNSMLMTNVTINYSRLVPGTGYIVDTAVTIGYSTPWRQVEAMLLEAAKRTVGIGDEYAPFVRQTALSDYYVEYRLVAYSPRERPRQRIEVLSDLHANIQDVFNEYGVQIMSPHYMLDPKEPQVVPRERWYEAPARPKG